MNSHSKPGLPEANKTLWCDFEDKADYHKIGGTAMMSPSLTTTSKKFTYSYLCTETNVNVKLVFMPGSNNNDVRIDNISVLER